MSMLKRKCCCSGSNYGCGCTGGNNCDSNASGGPSFPESFTITYTRWSLECTAPAGMYGDVLFPSDTDCVTPDPDLDGYFCSACQEDTSHPGGSNRYIGGGEIGESEVSFEVTMHFQDGTGVDPAPGTDGLSLCEAYYRGYVSAPYEGKESSELMDCDPAQESTFGGWYDCWRAKLTIISDNATRETRPKIICDLTMGQLTILEDLGYTPSSPNSAPNPDTGVGFNFSGVYSAEYRGVGYPLGDDINGNQYCGTCDFPHSALRALALFSGGDTYPGEPPMATGVDHMTQHGSFDNEYCGTPTPPYYYMCSYEVDFPEWSVYWWDSDDIDNYNGGGDDSPALNIGALGGCQGEWYSAGNTPRIGSWCTSTSNIVISPPGDCEFDPANPPWDPDCLSYQDPDSECVGTDVTIWYVWTGQRYLNVSMSV